MKNSEEITDKAMTAGTVGKYDVLTRNAAGAAGRRSGVHIFFSPKPTLANRPFPGDLTREDKDLLEKPGITEDDIR